MAPPASWDAAVLGWYSQKRTFKRKYFCVRPKYPPLKLDGIKRCIHRITMQQLEEERERERVEREEAASKEEDEGKRKVMEEEAAKATRLSELKAKAETLRQEKSNLFGQLKLALVEDAKRKQREERLERQRKEERDRRDKEQRAFAEAAQALTGAAQFHVYQREGIQPPVPSMGNVPHHPGAPTAAAYGGSQPAVSQPAGYPGMVPRSYFGTPERAGPQPPQPTGGFPATSHGSHHSMYPSPQAGLRRPMLPGGMQPGGGAFRDTRQDRRYVPMGGGHPAAPGMPLQSSDAPQQGGLPPESRDLGRGRGTYFPPQDDASRGYGPYGGAPQQLPRRW